jgi:5-methylcytosine-specific restriction endonuclease McrA
MPEPIVYDHPDGRRRELRPLHVGDEDTFEDLIERVWLPSTEAERALADCTHLRTQLCYRDNRAGARSYPYQCLDCGQQTRVVRKADLPEAQRRGLPAFDEGLGRRVAEARAAGRVERIQAERAEWWAGYSEYLESPEWQAKRAKILARAGGVCEGCGERPPGQVHHLTYRRLFRELLFDLVALCNGCHQACHPTKQLAAGRDD